MPRKYDRELRLHIETTPARLSRFSSNSESENRSPPGRNEPSSPPPYSRPTARSPRSRRPSADAARSCPPRQRRGRTGAHHRGRATGLAAGTTRSYRVRAVHAGGAGDWSGLAAATTERPQLTAAFEQVPAEHEGLDSTFTLRLVFSEAVSAGYRTLRDQAITGDQRRRAPGTADRRQQRGVERHGGALLARGGDGERQRRHGCARPG